MVYRVYVEKRPGLTVEADALKNDLVSFLGIIFIIVKMIFFDK